ncbi:MAG: SufD family Fe-S cluster assembly protein [Oscillospiraceae bacterium]|nr:SufD family Fe-S cluster assembly protein [Oscillospiraceae bacterium]
MDAIQKTLLQQVSDLHEVPKGAYSIRINGRLDSKGSSENIEIVTKDNLPGIDIYVKPGTKNESVHIPVIIAQTGIKELVYNDFHIGEDSDIVIVAGCGIHNSGDQTSEHSGIHRFFLEKNARVKYVEKHYGEGEGTGERIMNPTTEVTLGEGAYLEMETTQIRGIDNTIRVTKGTVGKDASFIVREKILTHGKQFAETGFDVKLEGENSSTHVVSRSVAQDESRQLFRSHIDGDNLCEGRSECDAIIMDSAVVSAIPEINANHPDASLVHEAAIGRIAGEQLIKLMTLGLTQKEAEEQIINGFLK